MTPSFHPGWEKLDHVESRPRLNRAMVVVMRLADVQHD